MAAHPLDPLSPTEFQSTAAILRRDQGVTDSWRFASIELKEPPKIEVKAWKPGDAVPRRSLSVLWDKATNETYEAVVDLVGDRVDSWTHLPGVCPNFTVDEYHDVDHAMHEHPEVLAALAARGITDLSLVLIDVWTYGKAMMPEQWRDRRLGWCDLWMRETPDGNPYAHPVSGLKIIVDMNTLELLEIEDHHDYGLPEVDAEYDPRVTRHAAAHRPQAAGDHPARGHLLHRRRQRAALAELVDAAGLQLPRGPGDLPGGLRRPRAPRATSPTGCPSPRWWCPTATRASTTTGGPPTTSASGVSAT